MYRYNTIQGSSRAGHFRAIPQSLLRRSTCNVHVWTDHSPLRYIETMSNHNSKLMGWVLGQKGTDKMVWTKWYTDKMVLDTMVWTKWYGQNGMDKMLLINHQSIPLLFDNMIFSLIQLTI